MACRAIAIACTISVAGSSFAADSVSGSVVAVDAGSVEEGRLTSSDVRTVRATVYDGDGRVAGASVWVSRRGDRKATTTSGDGAFVLDDVPALETICASEGDRAGAVLSGTGANVTVYLDPAFTLVVEVRDDQTGAPLGGADVSGTSLLGCRSSGRPCPEVHFEEDRPGRYVARTLGKVKVEFQAVVPGYLFSGRRTVAVDRVNTKTELRIGRGLRLSGRVLSAGDAKPVVGASIDVLDAHQSVDASTYSGDGGTFAIRARPGPVRV
jgi:hypothetical protein